MTMSETLTRKPPTGRLESFPSKRDGDIWRAKIRVYDDEGKEHPRSRRIGKAWTKRSRPPEGCFTRGQAGAKLPAIIAEVAAEVLGEVEPSLQLTSLAMRPPEVAAAPISLVTFGQICREYLHYAKSIRKVRPSTLNGYRNEIERVLIPAFGEDTPAESIDPARWEAWQEERIEADVSADTVNHNVGIVRRVYKRARKKHGTPNHPADVENLPVRKAGDITVLEPGEVLSVTSKATSLQDEVIIIVAAFCGVRLSELRGLRWRDIRWRDSLIYVRTGHVEGVDDMPKSDRVRSVPLVDQAAAALNRLSRREHFTDDGDRVFIGEAGGPMNDSAMRRRWYAMLEAAGFPRDSEGNPYMRFHDLRHTFGTIAVRIPDVTLPDVQAMMGHSNITTTMRYVHYRPRTAEAARFSAFLADAIESAGSTVGPPAGDISGTQSEGNGAALRCRRRDSNPRHADYDSAALTS
jgi:integrase